MMPGRIEIGNGARRFRGWGGGHGDEGVLTSLRMRRDASRGI